MNKTIFLTFTENLPITGIAHFLPHAGAARGATLPRPTRFGCGAAETAAAVALGMSA